MQIKTTFRFHLTILRMAIFKGNNNKCSCGWSKTGTLIHCWWECKLVHTIKSSIEIPQKAKDRTAI
jgi:hypothetical protein